MRMNEREKSAEDINTMLCHGIKEYRGPENENENEGMAAEIICTMITPPRGLGSTNRDGD
jgi:hypothetical protein